ncbi:hypothetical protein ACFTXO_02075 [Streptomyces sp. NPDC057067]|uniref:hypothetical protein n=1 Tax=Streptomyces TaxID=1883 RepID=UPI0019249953|nr:hypothetical protein [Streptomyces silvae]MBL1289190.1 hypothetical protein [Streptomyces silvae]
MTPGEISGRSMARAHLSQLIAMFGTDGHLQIRTTPEPDTSGDGEAEDDERA